MYLGSYNDKRKSRKDKKRGSFDINGFSVLIGVTGAGLGAVGGPFFFGGSGTTGSGTTGSGTTGAGADSGAGTTGVAHSCCPIGVRPLGPLLTALILLIGSLIRIFTSACTGSAFSS